MFWLMFARGGARVMIVGGLLLAAVLGYAGNDLAWVPLAWAVGAVVLLVLVEREIRR